MIRFGVFLLCCCSWLSATASAKQNTHSSKVEQVYYLNIARADAATVLNKLARQTDSIFTFSYEQASALQANALYGHFTLAEALHYVLLDSGLTASFTPSGIQILPVQVQVSAPEVSEPLSTNEETKATVATEVIRVDGLRRSLYKAQDIKRHADSILDVVVAEDIGKLPDITAAESIARLTGVQVFRYEDEVNRVLIRGLPNFVTTYNGREFFTAEQRVASLQDFPSQALAGIEIYKSATAEIIEPGLAGLINVTTRRPFDFDQQKIAGGLHLAYNDQSQKSSPNGHLLYANRWNSSVGEVGVLFNATYAASEYYNGTRYNATWFPTAEDFWSIEPAQYAQGGFTLPASVGLYNAGGKRWRPSFNSTLQWRVDDNFEIYFDAIYQGYRSERYTDNFNVFLTDSDPEYGQPVLKNVVLNQQNQAVSLTKTGGRSPWIYRLTADAQTNTYQYAVGGTWRNNGWKVSTDLAYTDTSYSDYVWSFDTAINSPITVDADFFVDGSAAFNLTDFNANEVNLYQVRGYYEAINELYGNGVQWRTDIAYTTSLDWLHTIKAGIRYTDRSSQRKEGARYAWLLDLDIPVTDINFLDMQLTEDPVRSSQQKFVNYLAPSRSSIADNHVALANFAEQGLLQLAQRGVEWQWAENQANNWQQAKVAVNPASYFLIDESSYAAYAQLHSYIEYKGVGIDSVLGLRATQTSTQSYGNKVDRLNQVAQISQLLGEQSNEKWLPSLNIKMNLTDDLLLRFSYAKTFTRPYFADLNASFEITQIINTQPDQDSSTIDALGSGGNYQLKPVSSKNYDLSLEYYFAELGYISAALFQRNIQGFISTGNTVIEDEQYGTISLMQPSNSGRGKIYGTELNTQMLFDFLPGNWQGLGMSANATYLDGTSNQGNDAYVNLPELSKWTYNFSLFYELAKWGARLSYNTRSSWINWYNTSAQSTGFIGNKTQARSRLDFSLNYQMSEHISIYADVINLLAEPFKNYTQYDLDKRYPQDVRDEGRYFGIGLRFNY